MAKQSKTVASVMARNNWPGPFKRRVFKWSKDKATGKAVRGECIETLTFTPGVATSLTAEQFEAVKGDIGRALVEVEYDEGGRPRVIVPDSDRSVELETTIQGQQVVIDEQAAALKAQQEAIDLLVTQVKELGAVPVVDVEGESGSVADETTKTE